MRFTSDPPRPPRSEGARDSYHHGNLREALITAALALIAERGPAGFTFAEVARAAGVSAAAPYRHFRDRNALVAEIARQGFERFATILETAWNTAKPDPFAAIENCGRAYLAFARREPAAYAAMFEPGFPLEDDANLLRAFLGVPLLTLKVTAAIHLHALKLWWKGLKLKRRPGGPNHTVDHVPEAHSQP